MIKLIQGKKYIVRKINEGKQNDLHFFCKFPAKIVIWRLSKAVQGLTLKGAIKLVIHWIIFIGWVDTHFGQEKVEEDCVELAKEVEEDSDDSDALDMEDFDPDVDDLVVGTQP